MEYVAKTELDSFRKPDAEERREMADAVARRLKVERLAMAIWAVVCACMEIGIVASIFEKREEAPTGETAIGAFLAIALIAVVLCLFCGLVGNRKLMGRLSAGDFEVLDCRAYEAELSTDTVGGCIVRICAGEQRCRDDFVVDMRCVKEWQENKNIGFRLLKCRYGKGETYYQMFPGKKKYG